MPVACKLAPACCAVTRLLVGLQGWYKPSAFAAPQFTDPIGLPFAFGAKLGWLKKLKASMRNCRLSRSETFHVLETERSSLKKLGPRQKPGDSLPMLPMVCPTTVKAPGL